MADEMEPDQINPRGKRWEDTHITLRDLLYIVALVATLVTNYVVLKSESARNAEKIAALEIEVQDLQLRGSVPTIRIEAQLMDVQKALERLTSRVDKSLDR